MSMKERVPCTRCGRQAAFSEEQLAHLRATRAPADSPFPPPIPAGVCMRCAFQDPDLKKPMQDWMKGMMAWTDQEMGNLVRRARELAVRPLEAIDRFIESLR